MVETAFIQIIPKDDPKQALRLHRFFIALAIYILAGFLAYISYLANIMEWEVIYACLIGIPLINIALYIIFRTGLNLRMPDPSLTSIQMCIAILVVTYGMYYANEARGFLLLVYVPIFLFGIFRLHTRQFLFISVFALLTYGIDIALFHVFHPQRVNLRIEYLQWSVLSIALVIFSFMGGYLSSLRQNLSISSAKMKEEIGEREKAQESMAQSNASLQTINTIADRIYRALDYPSLAREAIAAMVEYGKTATATMFEYNEDENCLVMIDASEPLEKAYSRVLTQRLYLNKSAAGDAVREKKIIFCEDIATDPRILPATKEALLKEGRKSGLFIPLLFQDRVMGTMNLVFTERLSFKDYELETLLSIGKTIGLAMANVRHIQQIKAEIQERKEAEEALRKSEDKYRTLIETTGTGYVIIDQDGFVQDANPEYVRLTGYHNLSEIVGRSVMEWTADSEKEKNAAAIKACLEKGYIRNLEIDYVDTKGIVTPIEINATCMEIDGKMQTITMCRDITERKRAADQLTLSEQQMRAILQASPIGIGRIRNRVIEWANETMCQITGYSLEEFQDRNTQFLYENEAEYVRAGEILYREGAVETRWIRNNGEVRDISLRITQTSSYAYICTAMDITLHKQAEEALRETSERYKTIIENIEEGYYEVDLQGNVKFCNSSLMKMLGFSHDELIGINNRRHMDEESAKKVFATFNKVYRTSIPAKALDWELIKKNKEKIFVETSVSLVHDSKGNISGFKGIIRDVTERKEAEKNRKRLENRLHRAEKMEALGTMAGGVAHDLNNVLGVLVGYSELLLLGIPKGNPLRKYVTNIMQSGQKGATIVQDLLTLARRGVPVLEVVNLNKVVSGFFQTPEFEKLMEYHPHVVFKTELEDELLSVKGSPVHMEKTIMNLLSNAAESIISAGEVLLRTQNIYLDKPIHGYDDVRQGDYVTLSVSDNGKGIASADLARIFEPFYTKKVMGRSGTGLGLTVVWGTVKDHDGYINVQSEEGKGSVFTLFFPVTREAPVSDIQHESLDRLMGNGESILVIDDVKEQRELAANILSRLGYKVDMVACGEEALEYLKTHKADLLLLDMIMDPGIDGLETYQRILKINPKQKAVIVSGFSETDRVHTAQALGAGEYVKKPYVIEKMGMAVRKELDRSA